MVADPEIMKGETIYQHRYLSKKSVPVFGYPVVHYIFNELQGGQKTGTLFVRIDFIKY